MILSIPSAKILLHPNIPKPLHGLNPRTILGKDWWDLERHTAYVKFDECCWACGVSKYDAKWHQWLEGHEYYKIDYAHGRAEMIEVTALCHACHNFIHNGRMLMMLASREMNADKFWSILYHGFSVLKSANLPPNSFALHAGLTAIKSNITNPPIWTNFIEEQFNKYPVESGNIANWKDWRLVIDSKEYKPLFSSFQDWLQHYSKESSHE